MLADYCYIPLLKAAVHYKEEKKKGKRRENREERSTGSNERIRKIWMEKIDK